jgi:uncharacterized protein DUF6193
VALAAHRRLFFVNLEARGVILASGSTTDLVDMVRAVAHWVRTTCLLREITLSFPFLTPLEDAESYERGDEVQHRWRRYLSDPTFPVIEVRTVLAPVIAAAATRRELRQLFPFTSHSTLCFSRCTGYPYTFDIPAVVPIGPNEFEVRARGGVVLGRGDAVTAVDLVVGYLPANCGPAVPGSSDDLIDP